MNWVQALFKNTLALGVAAVAYRVGLTAVEILVARSLDVASYGRFATALGFATFFLVLLDLGVNLGLVRIISRREADAPVYFGNSLLLRLAIAALVYPAMLAVAAWVYPPPLLVLVALLGLFVILMSQQDLYAAVFQGLGAMEWIAGFRILAVGAVALGVGAVLARGGDVRSVAIAYAALAALGSAAWLAVTWRRYPPRFDRRRLGEVLRYSALYGLAALFAISAFRVGVPALSLFASQEEVGLFAAGVRVMELLRKLPVLLSMVLLPLMFRSAAEAPERLDRLYALNLRLSGLGLLPLAALVVLFAEELVDGLYGPEYRAAAPLLRVLGASLPFTFAAVALGDAFTSRDQQARLTGLQGVVLGVALVAHATLAPTLGAWGSTLALLLTEVVLCGALVAGLWAGVAPLAPLRALLAPATATLLASGLAAGARHGLGLGAPAALAGFAAVYLLVLWASGALRADELRRLARALTARRSGQAADAGSRDPKPGPPAG